MYSASNAFHTAVRNGNPQKVLLIFSDAVFTNEDVDINTGIEFNEYFNTEEDLCIGQALSNELRFALINDHGKLNEYGFGKFTATLGVRIADAVYTESANCSARYGDDIYTGHDASPYIRKNGTGISGQPDFSVKSILVYDGTIYAFGSSGQCKRWINGSGSVITLNDFMIRKAIRWSGKGFGYNSTTRILTERDGSRAGTYEFVPLGVFTAERPKVPDVVKLEFHCHDLMLNLDKDMPDPETLGMTYPSTIANLFEKICTYFQVPYETSTFINSTATIAEEPEEFANTTARTVISWIAEAAGSNARINRDGNLVMDWVRNSGFSIDESGYSSFLPYWYETQTVSKLRNRDTGGSEETGYGSGTVEYLIQDNPILRGSE